MLSAGFMLLVVLSGVSVWQDGKKQEAEREEAAKARTVAVFYAGLKGEERGRAREGDTSFSRTNFEGWCGLGWQQLVDSQGYVPIDQRLTSNMQARDAYETACIDFAPVG